VVGQEAGARQRYAELAHQYFVAQGAPRREAVVSLAEVSRAIGISRSSLYRHWETAADLSNAVVGHLATTSMGWQHHLRLDPGEPVAEAVRRLFADPRAYEGLAIWPAITTDPASSDVRLRCARFERAFVARLARHLELTTPTEVDHPVPWTDLAVAVAALIDGVTTAWAVVRPAPGTASDPALTDVIVDVIADLVVQYPAAVTGPDRPIDEPDGRGEPADPSPGARSLLERIAAAVDAGTLSVDPAQHRIVDVEDLARRSGVTSRFLFQLWPTASDMNGDVLEVAWERLRANAHREDLAVATELAQAGGTELSTSQRVRWAARGADPLHSPEGTGIIPLIALVGDRALAARSRSLVADGWLAESGIAAASALQAVGARLRPGRTLRDAAVLSAVRHLGMWRIAGMHETIGGRRLELEGEQLPATGIAMFLMSHAIISTGP